MNQHETARLRKIIFLNIAILAAVSSVARVKPALAQVTSASFDAVDAYISTRMKELGIPGTALVIVQDDQIVHLKAFGVADAEGRPPIAFDWYRSFLQAMLDAQAYTWFAKLVAVSEVMFGVLLIAGVFVGLTAFFSGFMNWNFIMAGSASVNGVFFGLAVLLVLAWKIASYLGVDYFLLPRVADLWTPQKK
jgi:hypothetical protein